MARPLGIKSYTDKDGITHRRGRCSVEGCNCRTHLCIGKRDDGSKYYIELTTCCKHRKDGSTYRCNDPDKRREQIWRAQGIFLSFLEYQQIFSLQDGRCAICGIPEHELNRVLNVDHCHRTGKIRGLVCGQCNITIGRLENVTSLDDLRQFLNTDVFDKYKGIITENPKFKRLRK